MSNTELSSRYSSQEVESKWYKIWESKGYFKPRSDSEGKKFQKDRYVIVIPPPNVTGILHMGHALNNSIQDVMIRWNRMRGKDVLWVPGVDHAGIATQNVVEKKLAKQKLRRDDLGREKFLEEVWKWKEDHGNTITLQLRRLGASCDWSRERFTMDEGLSKAVRECFVTLYERGLIYRGNYIINWCPRCQTALSDEESAHKEVQGGFYHIRYPISGFEGKALTEVGKDHIVVATTRPETMLGDTAVAVNPKDARYKNLIGKKLILPLIGREIPIISDEFVDSEFGTGLVKVTPAHDPNDFEMGKRHDLPEVNVMNPDGTINEHGGQYVGLDRFEARKRVIKDLEEQELFVRRDSHLHSVGHCYRCDTVVEPYLSKQWFVKMKPLADKALKAHKKGKTTFYPDRWTKVYTNWLEGIRDWCISRQIWWGHQIPVWYCDDCMVDDGSENSKGIFVSRETPEKCPTCDRDNLYQDPDVLDTWFSSWLWPFSTLGWPEKTEDVKYFYPTSDLITAPEIIFFWVARMIMAGLEFKEEVPYNRIYLHGTVRAEGGLKMSKSLGNSIDPLEVIDEMGADALRFSMIMLSAQDVYISRQKLEVGRNFNNKLWNAARFVLMNLQDFKDGSSKLDLDVKSLPVHSRWILSRLEQVTEDVNKYMGQFGLSQASTEIYHFVWNDFCDWYIELAKPSLTSDDKKQRQATQAVLFYTLEKILRLLQPFSPFITEEIWQTLKPLAKDSKDWAESIMLAGWPEEESFKDDDAEMYFRKIQAAMSGLRDLRANLNIPPSQKLDAVILVEDKKLREVFEAFQGSLEKLGKLQLSVESSFQVTKAYVGNAYADFKVYLKIEGVVDPEAERKRIQKKIEEVKKYVRSLQGKLSNEKFVSNAPKEIVDREKKNLSEAEQKLKAQEEQLTFFQSN